MTANLPQFEVSRDERADEEGHSTVPVSIPTELGFAQEVRTERLDILWKVSLFGVFLVVWVLIVISGGKKVSLGEMFVPTVLLALGCVLTGRFLRRGKFDLAVWSYALGAIISVSVMITLGGTFGERYAPFILPLVVFVVGLLISVRSTLVMMALVYVAVLGLPSASAGKFEVGGPTLFALGLTTLATGLSAQVSGELFAIAEWALENYRKERRTTFALFESRAALEKSFNRQRALTQQVQEANRELEVARQAEEEAKNFRGQFLANMSHELRTPLNAIIGFSQTMLDFPAMYDGVDLPGQYRQDMGQILSSGKHLLTIINDILDLSKVDAGKLDLEIQPVDLGPIVKGVLSTAVGLVGDKGEHISLLKEVPDPLPIVMGDPLRVRQVLLNLYSNAGKFTDTGHIKLRVWSENNEVIFAVEDTGIGIAESDKMTIFEEFRQGTAGRKKGRQGAGLGLAISQQLLRLMKGRLWFESTLGQGSTFYFALSAYVPEAEPEAAQESSPADPDQKKEAPVPTDAKTIAPAATADVSS